MNTEMKRARDEMENRRLTLLRSWRVSQLHENELLGERRPEWNEMATDQRLADLVDRLGERQVAELREILAALRRIDGGTWGTCEACSTAIPAERLRVFPEARFCTACAPEAATAPSAAATLDDERFVADIADAIRSYDESVWGICKRCGENIDSPGAEYCQECSAFLALPSNP